MKRLLTSLFALNLMACGPAAEPPGEGARAWRGSITTEGATTTVTNEGGSVWAGTARLVEEASIGVLEGPDEYMLGGVASIAADDERIYVADRQVPVVRMYDHRGMYVGDLGAAGEGPGEYGLPSSVAVAPDGRVMIRDDGGRKINAYDSDGSFIEQYRLEGGLSTGTQMVVAHDGRPYTPVIAERLPDDPTRVWILGMQAHGPDGPDGEPLVPPQFDYERGVIVWRSEGSSALNAVPFWPGESWTLTTGLGFVAGVATDYSFEIQHPDGSRLVVERNWDPVPVDPDEADWHRRRAAAQMRTMDPSWIWNGPDVPATKPAYDQLLASVAGDVWVVRPGRGQRLESCNADAETPGQFAAGPCWRTTSILDLFGADGRFLGSVDTPAGMQLFPPPHIDGDRVIARVDDADGTVFVKRYRLVREDSRP